LAPPAHGSCAIPDHERGDRRRDARRRRERLESRGAQLKNNQQPLGGSMNHVARHFPHLLVLLKAVLVGWGVLGLIEYIAPAASLGLQNANFPAGTQFLHFAAILATGAIFIGGYFGRWRHTPFATVVMYAVLATLCFIETVDFGAWGAGPTRFIFIAVEYAMYVGLSVYLLRSATMRQRFAS